MFHILIHQPKLFINPRTRLPRAPKTVDSQANTLKRPYIGTYLFNVGYLT